MSTESVECRREPRLMQLDGFRDMCGCQALVVQKLQTPQLGNHKGPRACGVAHGVAEHRQAAQGPLAPQMHHLPHIHQLITPCNLIVLQQVSPCSREPWRDRTYIHRKNALQRGDAALVLLMLLLCVKQGSATSQGRGSVSNRAIGRARQSRDDA